MGFSSCRQEAGGAGEVDDISEVHTPAVLAALLLSLSLALNIRNLT